MRKLKDWLEAYLEFTQPTEAPDVFHFWVGVGTIAAALRRKVYINQVYFEWTPNFYICLVAPPGVATKSSAIGVGEQLLADLGTIRLGPSAATWQAMIKLHAEAQEAVQMPDGAWLQMSCVTYCTSELGTLVNFHDPQMIDVLCDLWDGRRVWSKATAHFGSSVLGNPWVNILAGTTPAWLSDNLPASLLAGGFVARTVFVYADRKRRLIAYPKHHISKTRLKVSRDDILSDLERISLLKGEFGMTSQAIEWGTRWYEQLYLELQAAQTREWQGYLARKQTHAHKLAMVLSASRSDSLVIELGDLQRAVGYLSDIEAGMLEVHRMMTFTPEGEQANRLAELVAKRGPVPLTDLYRVYFTRYGTSFQDFQKILESAARAGLIVQWVDAGRVMVGTPASAPGQGAQAP